MLLPFRRDRSRAGATLTYDQLPNGLKFNRILLPPKYSFKGPQLQMAASLLYSILLMLLHHLWNRYLDGKAVNSTPHIVFGKHLTDQTLSEVVGSGIAYVVGTSLATGIGVGFVQVLWANLRRGHYTLREVDAMVSCKGGMLNPSSFVTWKCAFSLAALGTSASLMSLVTIITPGSLRVVPSDFAFPAPCSVPTVSLSKANISTIFLQPSGQNSSIFREEMGLGGLNLQRFAEQVFLRGSPLPSSNPCSGECKYEIRFSAPAANCTPFGAEAILPSPDADQTVVWWGQHYTNAMETSFQATSRSPVANSVDAVNCAFFNATYVVNVTHSNSSTQALEISTTVNLFEPIVPILVAPDTDGSPIAVAPSNDTVFVNTLQQYVQLVFSLWPILETTIEYGNNTAQFQTLSSTTTNSTVLAYSPLFERSFEDPWKLACNVSTLISTFMTNISLSLLSDVLSTEQNPTTTPFDTTCWYSSERYSYDAPRLLITYGCGIGIAAICMLFGFVALYLNGMDESISFSRILGATLNESFFDIRFELSKESLVTGEGGTFGSLTPVRTPSEAA
ncbi:hypothetical protein SCHPADRAFT_935253 [Schizopora paradoxa]|uniref:Uncharacterized protein n=1 Tax=Schizopora paradoxa TaxID=27342 RepID=A0A0H2S5F2_9AGAM|nr:hypothetical protein SCHPADRAFT_935253 [Schizopora paradoxa]